jgi:predicted ester cyclase
METQTNQTSAQKQNLSAALALYRAVESMEFQRAKLAENFKVYVGGNVLDADAWIGMGQMFMTAFPDGRHVFELAEEVGDYVLLHGYFTGTHKAPFQGLPATGRTIRSSMTIIDKWKDGKLLEHRVDFDTGGMMAQLTSAGAA